MVDFGVIERRYSRSGGNSLIFGETPPRLEPCRHLVALIAKAVAMRNQRPGVVMKPLGENRLQIKTYLALRADESSQVVIEFAQTFLRKCSPPFESGAHVIEPRGERRLHRMATRHLISFLFSVRLTV
jgi:hypothetical protein